ncbi:MAG: viperin family antiviral radical SAM protein [Bacteroidia bacterium]|jgi:radical S-adenosyl methionine domain-containing protein 2|nr:viperin family antiviral radical SAM protein [Bacteroidia bacterium]
MKPEESLSSSKDDPDSIQPIIPVVNFHLWQACNFRCKFCFATFSDVKSTILPKGHIPLDQANQVVLLLAEANLKKITFAGGEPTLCPWLPELVNTAKNSGMTTGIITNGSKLNREYLAKFEGKLDWIGLSIDSINSETNVKAGRGKNSTIVPNEKYYQELCLMVKESGFKLKINTVVHAFNKNELISDFILGAAPLRWKVMRVLPVDGQNNIHYPQLEVTDSEFESFIKLNTTSGNTLNPIVEDHDNMRGSYLMIDPAGRFFDNVSGKHRYSLPIIEVGVNEALKGIKFSHIKFIQRNGQYNWS